MERFQEFLSRTSLHGFSYLATVKSPKKKSYWIISILVASSCAGYFSTNTLREYFDYRATTTYIGSNAKDLSSVYFPSTVICNINRVRKSFFKRLGLSDPNITEIFTKRFRKGSDIPLNDKENDLMNKVINKHLLIVGSTGLLGFEFTKQILNDFKFREITTVSKNKNKVVITNE